MNNICIYFSTVEISTHMKLCLFLCFAKTYQISNIIVRFVTVGTFTKIMLVAVALAVILAIISSLIWKIYTRKNLPPGPTGLPIIGQ